MAFALENQLLVTLDAGEVRVVEDGALRPEPSIGISGFVRGNDDRELVCLGIHPHNNKMSQAPATVIGHGP